MSTIAQLEARISQFRDELAELHRELLSDKPPVNGNGHASQLPVQGTGLRLDLGCGAHKREGFTGVDVRKFDGVDTVADLTQPWPWATESVEDVHCSQFLEHLTAPQRIHFANELFRVLKHGAKATIITPHWCSERAYGDLTHQWPPVSEMWFLYLNAKWRSTEAPHNTEYTCDFEAPPVIAHNVHPALNGRNAEYVMDKLTWAKGAATDLMVTLRKP